MFTYEVSPFFNIVEEIVIKKMAKIIGWSTCDGIFSPGLYFLRDLFLFLKEFLLYSMVYRW